MKEIGQNEVVPLLAAAGPIADQTRIIGTCRQRKDRPNLHPPRDTSIHTARIEPHFGLPGTLYQVKSARS